jgi:hypothetical protein
LLLCVRHAKVNGFLAYAFEFDFESISLIGLSIHHHYLFSNFFKDLFSNFQRIILRHRFWVSLNELFIVLTVLIFLFSLLFYFNFFWWKGRGVIDQVTFFFISWWYIIFVQVFHGQPMHTNVPAAPHPPAMRPRVRARRG